MPGGASGGGRPPWVRDSTDKEAPAWTLRRRSQQTEKPAPAADPDQPTLNEVEEQLASVKAKLKKSPAKPKTENGVSAEPEKPVTAKPLKKVETVKKPEPKEPAKEKSEPVVEKPLLKKPPAPLSKTISKDDVVSKKPPVLLRQTSKEDSGGVKKWRDPLLEKKKEIIDNTLNEIPKGHTLTKNESLRSLLKPVPPPPPPPPLPPKLPPPPDFKKPPPTADKLKRIEALKSRPRKRPDWSDMMKEVETGRKLKHVVCNDRSSPVITKTTMVKTKGQYVYESEKENVHNQLLKQINQGIKLKKVKTNDRSRPNLDGLRKFRRQMTIEEQIQKSMSKADLSAKAADTSKTDLSEANEEPEDEEEIDEMDDIDKVRDDLQSTKQLLALELRNKEAQQRENKRLLSRIANLEAELASERAHVKQEQAKTVISVVDAYDETLVTSLKREVTDTKRVADDLQKKYHRAAEELDDVQAELEEAKRKNAELEKKLEQALKNLEDIDQPQDEEEEEPKSFFLLRTKEYENQLSKIQGIVPNSNQGSRRPSHAQRQQSVQEEEEEELNESSGEEGEDEEAKQARRNQRELKMLGNKIKNLKEKKDKAKKEREGLKVQLKNQQKALKEEKKKYKALKKEVDKMAKLLKESEDDENEDEDEDEEAEEEEEDKEASEEESESETEEESESETESESEEEDAPVEKKKENLTSRAKKHESSLSALKKGNYLIIANIDRLKDDITKQKDDSATLQEDLDSLLVEF